MVVTYRTYCPPPPSSLIYCTLLPHLSILSQSPVILLGILAIECNVEKLSGDCRGYYY